MIRAFLLAVGQITEPALFGVTLRSVLATLLLALLLVGGVWYALFETTLFKLPYLEWAADVLGGLLVVALPVLLFPALVVAVSGFFLDEVVKAVERRHYPALPPGRDQGVLEGLWSALKFLGLVLVLNLLFLPLYLVPGLNLILFPALNGYLLGREYFELVAVRRMGPAEMRVMRRERRLGLFSGGVIIAFLSLVPFVNLLTPVLATAFMVHLFERYRRGLM